MITNYNKMIIGILTILSIVLILVLNKISHKKNKKQLDKIFIIIFGMFIFWLINLILQIIIVAKFDVNPIYFEYFIYISACYMPVAFLFMALIYAKTKISFKKKYLLLFIIPTISILMVWTNSWHHLFYEQYSTDLAKTVTGKYFIIHVIYTYLLYLISIYMLVKYSIKNAGFFSKQAILIWIGILIPLVTNGLGGLGIIPMSIYIA